MTSQPMSRRRLLASAGLGALLAACGSGGSAGGSGRLVLGVPLPVTSFDPYAHNTYIIVRTLYSYLVDYTQDLEPVPAIAEDWQISPDGRSVTITLRDTEFHSGAKVTAEDVAVGIERARNPETGLNQTSAASFIRSARVTGPRTVLVECTGPTAEGVVTDWMFQFPLVPASGNDPAKLQGTPAGSGPFEFVSYKKDRSLVLKRFAAYWDSGKPSLEEVEFRIFTDEDSLVASLESGSVDGAIYIAARHAERLRARFTVVDGPGRMDLFFMNPSKPPFHDKALRQALARAVDRDRILQQVRFGLGEPIYASLMPGSPAYDESYLDSHGFDLDAAAGLLAKVGGAREAVLAVGSGSTAEQIAQIIQADFRRIGFELTLEPLEQTAFLEGINSGTHQCFVAAQPNNLRSPSGIAHGRPHWVANNPLWPGGAPPKAYVDAVEAAKAAVTPEQARAAYQQLNDVLVDEAWAVGTVTRPEVYALDKKVTGFAMDPRDDIVLTDTRFGSD